MTNIKIFSANNFVLLYSPKNVNFTLLFFFANFIVKLLFPLISHFFQKFSILKFKFYKINKSLKMQKKCLK